MQDLKVAITGSFQGSTSILAIVGASLYWLWMDTAVFSRTLCALSDLPQIEIIMFVLATLASVVAYACLIRRKWTDSLFDKHYRLPLALAVFSGTLGSLAIVCASSWNITALVALGSILTSIFFALFSVAWGWVCVAQGHSKAILHISAAWALTLPLNLLFALLPPLAAGICVSILPLVSGGLFFLVAALQNTPNVHIEIPTFNKVPIIENDDLICGVDRRLLLIILVFCSVFGLMYSTEVFSTYASHGTGLAVLSVRSVTALVFFVATLTVLRDRVKTLFKVCFYVLVAGLAIMLIGLFVPGMGSLSGQLVAIGYCGFDILVWTMVAFHGYVSPNQSQRTVVVTMLAEQLGIFLGAVIGMVVELAQIDVSTAAVMMVGLDIAAIVVLGAYTEYGSQMWGLLIKTSLSSDEAFQAQTDELGAFKAAHKLTEREGDVLALIVQGRSFGHIAEKMYVSENTVKTHVRHIYAKCEVRGKQELIDLVERERANR